MSENKYDVWAIRDIPEEEFGELSEKCKEIFENTMLAGMCIPEVFENKAATVNTYESVVGMVQGGWMGFAAFLRQDVESQKPIRRYLATRSCPRNPRKGVRAKQELKATVDGAIIQPTRDIVGYVLSEWDMTHGTIFLALVVPWATGEVYDATTILIRQLIQRVNADRAEMNTARVKKGLKPYPRVTCLWTMMFFKRDSRMSFHLQKKRAFMPVDDYLKQYDDVSAQAFPPIRETYLPPHMLADWLILVRRQNNPHGDDWVPKKTLTELEGKPKEQRAQARRAAAMAVGDPPPG